MVPDLQGAKQVLAKLLPSAEHADIIVFEVDFDTQKDVVRAFGAQMQSTLITFKGKKEVGRLVAVTRADAIKRLLDSTG